MERADFSFKMPTKLLSSTLNKTSKSDTQFSSTLMSYKFEKEQFPSKQSVEEELYRMELKSI